jgi:hypothetical protein
MPSTSTYSATWSLGPRCLNHRYGAIKAGEPDKTIMVPRKRNPRKRRQAGLALGRPHEERLSDGRPPTAERAQPDVLICRCGRAYPSL